MHAFVPSFCGIRIPERECLGFVFLAASRGGGTGCLVGRTVSIFEGGSWQSVPVETSAYACSTKHTIIQAKHDRERGRMCTRVRHN